MAEPYVLDRAILLERLGDDEEIFNIMVDMFLQDVENNCQDLATALSSGVPLAVQREAHTIKGLLATLGDDGGALDAYRLEQLAKESDLTQVAERVAGLQARLREVAAVLKAQTGLGG